MTKITLAVVITLTLFTGVATATTTTYTSRPAWNTAIAAIPVAGTLTEDFSDNTVNQTWLSVTSTVGYADSFMWLDRIDDSPLETTTWSWTASPPMVAFGGVFDLAVPGDPGTGITVTANFVSSGWAYVMDIPSSATGWAFYGFTSTQAFTDVKFTRGPEGGSAETYNMDDLSYAWVPEPATFLLMGAGLLGLGLFGKRRGFGGK